MYTLNVEYFYSSTAFEHFFKYWTSQLKSGKEEMEEKSMLCDMLYSLHFCCFVHEWIKLIGKKNTEFVTISLEGAGEVRFTMHSQKLLENSIIIRLSISLIFYHIYSSSNVCSY